jgi:hypothetical protein
MRGSAVAILLGITAFVAYSLGHQNAPVTYQPVALTSVPPIPAKPVAFVPAPPVVMTPPAAPDTSPRPDSNRKVEATPPSAPDATPRPDSKRKVEAVLTAAAIAAIATSTMPVGDPALARMTQCATAGHAVDEALIPDRAARRRFAIPPT